MPITLVVLEIFNGQMLFTENIPLTMIMWLAFWALNCWKIIEEQTTVRNSEQVTYYVCGCQNFGTCPDMTFYSWSSGYMGFLGYLVKD